MKKFEDKISKKIFESRKKIKEEKKKIKEEKKLLRKKKYENFRKTKFGKFLHNIAKFIKLDKDSYSFTDVLVVTLCSLVIGVFSCFSVFMVLSGGKNYFVLSKDLGKFVEVYETLIDNYYDDINKDELINEAIKGMVSSVGDDYTNYIDEDASDKFDELVSGVYEGIGCTIQLQEAGIKVLEVYEGSPSEKADLRIGDIILKVDDEDATGMTADELSSYIKKSESNNIKLTVLRDKKEHEIILTRDKVEMPVVNSTIYEKNGKKIGYINISIFSSVAGKQFKNKLEDLEKENIDSLVIDVRDNNGGYLMTVTDIVSQLLPKGKNIYQIEKNDKREITKDETNTYRDYPIAVLVNGNSASASEILASAIKESYEGIVVGIKTYGKGTVQQTKKLSDGSMIKYTIENWLTPNGNWIDGEGIEPTHEVKLDKKYFSEPIVENDNQLQKALELVSK